MNAMAHRKMRAGLVLAIAATMTLLAIPAGFAYPMRSGGLVATTLGSQDPRDTAQSDKTAGLVPGRLGSPDPRDTDRKSQKSRYASSTVAARLGSPDPRGTASGAVAPELHGPVAPVGHESGFSWQDAGIGAGAALLFVAGLAFAAVAIRHNRRQVVSPA
jgi:hypothetical protein